MRSAQLATKEPVHVVVVMLVVCNFSVDVVAYWWLRLGANF